MAEPGARGRNLALNLGCGRGYSVLEALAAFTRAVGRPIPHEIVDRRPGDAAECVADPARAAAVLGWRAERDLDAMCADHWAFQSGATAPAQPAPAPRRMPPATRAAG
jgi:UDP-glucose 4-epimerase